MNKDDPVTIPLLVIDWRKKQAVDTANDNQQSGYPAEPGNELTGNTIKMFWF